MAQSATGQITGTVTDTSGAVIPNAHVTLSSQLTGLTRTTTTNAAGDYSFPLLPVSVYTVTTDQTGFKTSKRSDIQLNVDQVARVDFALQVGSVSESIEVRANSVTVDTENAAVSQLVTTRQINDLPMDGRSWLGLLAVNAGTVYTNGEQGGGAKNQGDAISINGGRPTSNNYNLDGTTITDTTYNTPAGLMSLDAISEFKVQDATYSAEYGFSANQVNIVSKSGTNDLHGAVFEFLRNDALDARSFFDRSIPALRQNQFGYVLGGPVYIPHVYDGRNKTFFLANFEGERISQRATGYANVPDPAWLSGQFTVPITDPDTGELFTNNTIPSSRFSRLAQVALANGFFPAPNVTSELGNYYYDLSVPTTQNQQTYRLDQNLGRFGQIYGRVTYLHARATIPQGGVTALSDMDWDEPSTNWQVSHTKNFGANIANVFRLGRLNSTANHFGVAMPQAEADKLGLTGVFTKLNDLARAWPYVAFSGAGGGLAFGGGATYARQLGNQPVWDISDTLSIVHGRHTIALGGEYRHWLLNRDGGADFLGNFFFSGIFTGGVNAVPQNAVADSLLGYYNEAQAFQPAAFSVPGQPGNPHAYVHSYFAPFFQDNWKVSPRLTLNLGLRFDWQAVPYDKNNHMLWLDVANPKGGLCVADQKLVTEGITGDNSYYRYCGRNRPPNADSWYHPFAPRIAFAWRPLGGDKTVIRGGYGIFFDSSEQKEMDGSGDLYPYITRSDLRQDLTTTPIVTTDSLFPPISLSGPAVPADNTFIAVIIAERQHHPYMQQWSLSVQRQLDRVTTFEVNYVGNRSLHLLMRNSINQAYAPTPEQIACGLSCIPSVVDRRPYENFAGYLDSDFSGFANYNSMNVKVERRTSALALTAIYTWAKSLDSKSAAASVGHSDFGWGGVLYAHNPRLDYGRSDFDCDQRFVTSFVWQLPFGRNRKYLGGIDKATNLLVGGWQLNGIATFQRGAPYSIFGYDNGGYLDAWYNRANLAGTPSVPHQSLSAWFNTAAFVNPPPGVYGYTSRNWLRGPGINSWDMSLFKDFNMTEKVKTQFRVETFNTFNHAQWGAPDFYLTSPQFGRITYTQVPGRIVQLGLKILF
jgi:hypothetical protein